MSPRINDPRSKPPPQTKTDKVPPPATQKKPPEPQKTQPQQSVLLRDSFSTQAQTKKPLSERILGDNPLLQQPTVMEDFLTTARLRATSRKDDQLQLPANPKERKTVADVPLPTDASKPTPSQAFVIDAAMKLGFSKEVATLAVAEMARRSGDQLTIDLDTKKPLLTAEDFKKAANDGTTDAYTFEPHQLAVLKDANLAAAYGMDSLDKLYAAQAQVLPELRQAAINGTDVDFDQMLKLVNDPATRDGMTAYYESMRVTRDLGHGNESAFEALPSAKARLEEALKQLPKGSPLTAPLQAMAAQMEQAQKTLLAGTESGGKTPRGAIALMNNLTNAPLGQLPDEDMVTGSIDNLVSGALEKGANPKQAAALRGALELAYGLRANGGSTPELLEANKQKLAAYVKDAGPLGQPLRQMFEKISQEAKVGGPAAVPKLETPADVVNNADTVSALAANLKGLASASGIPGLPDLLDALKNEADAVSKGGSPEGKIAGVTGATALLNGLLQLVAAQPGATEDVVKLLGRTGALFKLPTDVVGTFGNAYKVLYGADLDGKEISSFERSRAAGDLAENGVSFVAAFGAITGSQATLVQIAAAPPLAIPFVQYKLMSHVLEETAKMKGAIAQHELRNRFALGDGDDAQFKRALAEQAKAVEQRPITRSDQVVPAAQYLLRDHFKNSDTAARFQAFAAARVSGGRETINALMRGQVPKQYQNPYGPNVTTQDGAALIKLGKELKALTAEFYKNEVAEVRKTLNNQGGRNKGDTYMVTDEQRKQLRYSFPNRY